MKGASGGAGEAVAATFGRVEVRKTKFVRPDLFVGLEDEQDELPDLPPVLRDDTPPNFALCQAVEVFQQAFEGDRVSVVVRLILILMY